MPSLTRIGMNKTSTSLLLAGACALAAVSSLNLTGDEQLRTQFDTAFSNHSAQTLAINTAKSANSVVPVAASEDYWLGDARKTRATLASWNDRAVGLGDSVTLTMRGIQRQLKIVSLKELPVGSLPQATDASQKPVLVTLQPVDDSSARPIHMLLEGRDAATAIETAIHREL